MGGEVGADTVLKRGRQRRFDGMGAWLGARRFGAQHNDRQQDEVCCPEPSRHGVQGITSGASIAFDSAPPLLGPGRARPVERAEVVQFVAVSRACFEVGFSLHRHHRVGGLWSCATHRRGAARLIYRRYVPELGVSSRCSGQPTRLQSPRLRRALMLDRRLSARLLLTIKQPILNRLRQMRRLNTLDAVEVGDRPCHLQDPAEGPRAHPQRVHHPLHELVPRLIDPTEQLQLPGAHLGVAVDVEPLEALLLNLPRDLHPLSDRRAGLAALDRLEVAVADRRDLDVKVDAVEQRPRQPCLVAFDLPGGAGALAHRVARVAARTRV